MTRRNNPFKSRLKGIAYSFLLAALSPSLVEAAMTGEQMESIDSLFENYLQNSVATAAMFEVREKLDNGYTVTLYRQAYGQMGKTNTQDVPLNVMMRQASVTKSFTVAAIGELIRDGRLALDTRVFCEDGVSPRSGTSTNGNCAIPWAGAFGDPRYHDITIDHLVNHRSGILKEDPDEDRDSDEFQDWFSPSRIFDGQYSPGIEDMIDAMRNRDLDVAPDTIEQYSNRGYNLLAHVVSLLSPQRDYISYIRSFASNIGVCASDIRLSNPLFTGLVKDREPEYYSFNSWKSVNMFQRPSDNIEYGEQVAYEDGGAPRGWTYGDITTTTRAGLLLAEHFSLGQPNLRGNGIENTRIGGGAGTQSYLRQGYSGGRFDFMFTLNGNEDEATKEALQEAVKDIINDIAYTSPGMAIFVAQAAVQYDTDCPESNTIEEPNHKVTRGNWKEFNTPIQGATKVTLFNMNGDVDLYVREGTNKPTNSTFDCRPYKGGLRIESCTLSEDKTYMIGVKGYSAGTSRFLLDLEYPSPEPSCGTIDIGMSCSGQNWCSEAFGRKCASFGGHTRWENGGMTCNSCR